MSALVVLCACPDDASAARIATALVQDRLAACVNRICGVESTYRWQDKICDDREVLLLIKTTRAAFDTLRERILALHPYSVPEVIGLDAAAGSAAYLDWIESSVRAAVRAKPA